MVSIVMPSFNQCHFIGKAIDSILTQDYCRLELIVADGNSDDGTQELLKQRAQQDKRLRWFSEEDYGPANALNKAFRRVRGTLVGWLNTDDFYAHGAIRRAVAAMQSKPEWIMLYGHGQHVNDDGDFIGNYPTFTPETPVDVFADGCFICQPTVFFRRTMFFLSGALDEELKTAFDFDYWLRAFRYFHGRIGFVNEVQAFSRLHKSCITQRMRRTVILEGMQVIARHLEYAPDRWLLTYRDELLADGSQTQDEVKSLLISALEEAKPWLDSVHYQELSAAFYSG